MMTSDTLNQFIEGAYGALTYSRYTEDPNEVITAVIYEGVEKEYSKKFRSKFDTEQDFLEEVFKDFYDEQTDQLDAIQESLPAEIQLCYNDDCRSWKAQGEIQGYATIDCLNCNQHKILYKQMPEITTSMWTRLQEEASSK